MPSRRNTFPSARLNEVQPRTDAERRRLDHLRRELRESRESSRRLLGLPNTYPMEGR